MTADPFRLPAWCLATTLAERRAARRAGPPGIEPAPDQQRAAARLQRWRTQLPFRDGDYFEQRLALDQLTEAELLHHLGEPVEAVAAYTGDLDWLADLESAYTGLESWPPIDLPEGWRAEENIGLLDVIAPLLTRGRQRVREGARVLAENCSGRPFDPETVEELVLSGLPGQLLRMVGRTLALELNVARLRGQLTGATPAERFASFLERLRHADTALTLLREYPVLARQVLLTIDRWVAFSLEFLGHLAADWEALQDLLPGDASGPLADVAGSAGDTHRGGRAVLIAFFESGARVVYKPKPQAVDQHFQELLIWINDHAEGLPSLATHRVLDRGTYGWVEFVQAHGCASTDEVHRFYQRQGAYLALLYALEATDFHSENLIAAGEQPILLDQEALFHPRLATFDETRAQVMANRAIEYSVLRLGMLPRRVWSMGDSAGLDISGLGATGGQVSPLRVALMEGAGTDSVHLVRKHVETFRDQNRPTLDEADVELTDYTADIVAGFEIVYRLLQKHRVELLAADGPLAAFANDEVRVIIRETRTYTILLSESYHPDVLRDALDRDRLFDRLWVGIAVNPRLPRLIPSERADMLQGDIPMYTTLPGSRDLFSSGGERLADFFTASGLELVAERLGQFSEDDLARQRWIIEASLATSHSGKARTVGEEDGAIVAEPADRNALLAAAVAVGDRLEALALRDERGATWLGLNFVAHSYWDLNPLGLDLYNGLPGVALFLAYLGQVTGEARYTTLAQAATATLQQSGVVSDLVGSVGAFDGWGGGLYALSHLATLWDRPSLLAGARMIAGNLPPLIEKEEKRGIATGLAGCLAGLLSLHRVAPSGSILATAVKCGERILASTAPTPTTSGFMEGPAGVSRALLELASQTGEDRFRQAARQFLDQERSLTPGTEYSRSWCHGAAGVGLVQLQALRQQDDPALRAEIDAALKVTATGPFGRDHSLCHGDLGQLEFLLQAGEILDDPHWRAETARLAGVVLASIQRDGIRCAPQGVETPGLMIGLAGIGMGLLRLAEPTQVPSVLTFAPPR